MKEGIEASCIWNRAFQRSKIALWVKNAWQMGKNGDRSKKNTMASESTRVIVNHVASQHPHICKKQKISSAMWNKHIKSLIHARYERNMCWGVRENKTTTLQRTELPEQCKIIPWIMWLDSGWLRQKARVKLEQPISKKKTMGRRGMLSDQGKI